MHVLLERKLRRRKGPRTESGAPESAVWLDAARSTPSSHAGRLHCCLLQTPTLGACCPRAGLPVCYWERSLTTCSTSGSGHSRLSRCLTVVLPTSCFRSQCGGVPAGRPGPRLELGVRAAATGGSGSSARPASAWGSGGGVQLPLPGGFLQPGCPCTCTYSASPRWPLPCVRRPTAGDARVTHSGAAPWTVYALSV